MDKIPAGLPTSWEWKDSPVGVPSGLIAMWHGLIANIPAGYVICDGLNSTPNLLAKFVEGVATAGTNPGATGGEAVHTLTVAEMPYHRHSYTSPVNANRVPGEPHEEHGEDKSADTGGEGSDDAHENKPPFFDVAFLMKT